MGLWVALIIVIFVLGSILGLRISPREKALGIMRDQARKIGLHPRLVVAPDWTKIPKATEKRASMVAYYSVLLPQARLPLMRALVEDQQLKVVYGDEKFHHYTMPLKGIYAIDMQANCIGVYWDEYADLHATQLEEMKTYLISLSEI